MAATEGAPAVPASKSTHAYLHEVDLIRAFTAFTVVAIHSIATMSFLVTGDAANALFGLVTHTLNYNREVFIFVTGLVLSYINLNKPHFSVRKFYRGRIMLVFIPYVVWSIVYTLKDGHVDSFWHYIGLMLWNILTGNASPQLYYIILTMQIYLIFPLFLPLLRKVQRFPWQTLGIGLALQLLLVYLDFHYVQAGPLRQYQLTTYLLHYHSRLLPAYFFFVLLGGVAAVYLPHIKTFIQKYGNYIAPGMATAFLLYAGWYYFELKGLHESVSHATTVLQPSVVLYSIAVIVFFGWYAFGWAEKRPGYRGIKTIADMSFGIFFIQYIMLACVVHLLRPLLPFTLPVPIDIALVVFTTFALSVAGCYVLLKIPLLSWLIGKPHKAAGDSLRKLKLRFGLSAAE